MPIFLTPFSSCRNPKYGRCCGNHRSLQLWWSPCLPRGLRKLRAELRRHSNAWKIIATIQYPSFLSANLFNHNTVFPIHEEPIRVRTAFQSLFDHWYNTVGIQYIRSLRCAIPYRRSSSFTFSIRRAFFLSVT